MMMSMKGFVQAGFMASLLAAVAVAGATDAPQPATPNKVDTSGPSQLIDSAAKVLMNDIAQHRAEYRKDPTGLYKVVNETLLPNFDTAYAAQRVLGVHWRNASEDQRKRFVQAFFNSVFYTYGDKLLDFNVSRLKVFPTKVTDTDTSATVRTKISSSSGGKPYDVNYSMIKINGAWKAWDLTIDGISYVKSYREDYGAEVQQKGLDAVIARLEAKANAAKAAKGATQ